MLSCCMVCVAVAFDVKPCRHTSGKKKSLADYAIVRRIHFIFERAVRKFKTDLSLWTAWLVGPATATGEGRQQFRTRCVRLLKIV
jgi:hypothetical protein